MTKKQPYQQTSLEEDENQMPTNRIMSSFAGSNLQDETQRHLGGRSLLYSL